MAEKWPLTTWLPSYEEARTVVQFLEGKCYSRWHSMNNEISEKWWSADFKSKWSDPDEYIPLALTGENQTLAYSIWNDTNVNPTNVANTVSLILHHSLAYSSDDDVFTLTQSGKLFKQSDDATIARIDHKEGLLVIIAEVAAKGPGEARDFLPAFREFLLSYTTFPARNSGARALDIRLRHLRQRGLVDKRGQIHSITDAGLEYLRRHKGGDTGSGSTIEELVREKNQAVRQRLDDFLRAVDPFQFEHLIKRLLEVMGYEDVDVTSPVNDKGVDVVGEIELGISRVREVIQVKRQQSNVGRGILDSLRGALHRFDAVRATIITTSGFSSGAKDAAFEKGVAPITLIDGDRLLDLMIEYEIGVSPQKYSVLEFDEASLSQFESEREIKATLLP